MVGNPRKPRTAFSLLELVIALTIVGVLTAVAVPRFTSAAPKATTTQVVANLRILQGAIDRYAAANNDAIPSTGPALATALLSTIRRIPANANLSPSADGLAIASGNSLTCDDIPCGWLVDDTTLEVAECLDSGCHTGSGAITVSVLVGRLGL